MSLVYILFANVAEGESLHFYIPSDKVSDIDHHCLNKASDPVSSEICKDWFNDCEVFNEYARDGARAGHISHTYCISFMKNNKTENREKVKISKCDPKISIVYVPCVNIEENNIVHFYIPADKISEDDHFKLKQTSDQVFSTENKKWIISGEWDQHIYNGPQIGNITHVYPIFIPCTK